MNRAECYCSARFLLLCGIYLHLSSDLHFSFSGLISRAKSTFLSAHFPSLQFFSRFFSTNSHLLMIDDLILSFIKGVMNVILCFYWEKDLENLSD